MTYTTIRTLYNFQELEKKHDEKYMQLIELGEEVDKLVDQLVEKKIPVTKYAYCVNMFSMSVSNNTKSFFTNPTTILIMKNAILESCLDIGLKQELTL